MVEDVLLRQLSLSSLEEHVARWRRSDAGGTPFITLSYAQSLDGSIAHKDGVRTAISGDESLAFTHRLRARHDAVLVGIGTVLTDDPLLTVRLAPGPTPIRIVLDSDLRLPPTSRLLSTVNIAPVWVVTVAGASEERRRGLAKAGARVLDISESSDEDPWGWIRRRLAAEAVSSVMVEGGATVISSLVAADAFDAAVVTMALRYLGGLTAVAGPVPSAVELVDPIVAPAGEDLIVAGVRENVTTGRSGE